MTLNYIIPAVALGISLALSGPALATSSLASVPTLWPADGAFEHVDNTVIATRDIVVWETVEDINERPDR